ncbi:hypothetical protein C0581_04255 [Candidatus Parcubacteria bacterium]|nr:MAG: hypothetical protein C0581_04255 [Candidatus Parcubacteria bacterium]
MSEKGTRMDRKIFRRFYETRDRKPNKKYQEHIITQSLERLIDRGLITGFGKRTPQKWFLTHVDLTGKGIKAIQEIYHRRQKTLPFT